MSSRIVSVGPCFVTHTMLWTLLFFHASSTTTFVCMHSLQIANMANGVPPVAQAISALSGARTQKNFLHAIRSGLCCRGRLLRFFQGRSRMRGLRDSNTDGVGIDQTGISSDHCGLLFIPPPVCSIWPSLCELGAGHS